MVRVNKIVQCEKKSQYIYPPLKYSFRRTVRTIAYVILAVKEFNIGMLQAKIKRQKCRKRLEQNDEK